MKRSNWAQKAAGLVSTALVGLAAASLAAVPVDEELIGSDSGSHAATLGLAGATVSRARGVDALLSNPAGLAALQRSEFALSSVYAARRSESQFGRTESLPTTSTAFRFGSIGFAYDADTPNGFGVGIAYRQARDLDFTSFVEGTQTTGDFAGYRIAEDRASIGAVDALTLGLGVEVAAGVRLGASVDLWEGERERTVLFSGDDDRTSDRFEYDDAVTRLISASRAKIGAELGIVPEVTLGGTILFPSDVDIREEWTQRSRFRDPNGATDSDGASGITDYTLRLPAEFRGGATLRLPPFRFSAEARYADWSSASYTPAPARDVDRRQFARHYDPTVETRFGAELDLGEGAAVRFGALHERNPANWRNVLSEPVSLTVGLTTPIVSGVLLDVAYLLSRSEEENEGVVETVASHRVVVGGRCVF